LPTLGIPYQRLNEAVRKAHAVTPTTALCLAEYFGTTAFWTNL
jgi:plasmid maintenance system antidote protein VapI